MKVFDGIADLTRAEGTELGVSEWIVVDQERINRFADATGDHQWIHVDVERAANGPFGGTIAHGLLTVSLMPSFHHQIYRVDNVTMAVNYGLNKVRLPAAVPAGSRLRGSARVLAVSPLEGAVQVTFGTTIEIEGGDKPACIIESIVRYIA